MAIRMTCSKEHAEAVNFKNVEVITDNPLHSVKMIHHHYSCIHSEKERTYESNFGAAPLATCTSDQCKNYEPLYMETTYIGCVVSQREMNGYDDSDFYAMVWDESEGVFKEIMYATTRGWTYLNSAVIDATPEIRAKYDAHCEAIRQAKIEAWKKAEAAAIRVGKKVQVFKGRKLPKGTEGEVFWVGPCKFNRNKVNAGLKLTNGEKVFVDSANLQVI